MNTTNYYRKHLTNSYKQLMMLGVYSLLFLTLFVIGTIVWSFSRYRHATQHTYVFHPKGAAIAIYDERTNSATTKAKTATISLPKR
ncbi:hypothetical protein [Fibrella aquatilis]|uniref:Uncharacterized protein n=1 Tax=Fibrella aquatilis TaxID=2817059 RepID=A0A939G612_9BACT|nr:hypothetical protein [Fibrella aquatilis]MBO0931858.1 hypothetical protein [Fibrella aquatilis]